MRFKALVHVRLRGSVSDAAGNAVMNNVKRIAPHLEPHLFPTFLQYKTPQLESQGVIDSLFTKWFT